jgi:putative spermidine/putrescine transport system permease protein
MALLRTVVYLIVAVMLLPVLIIVPVALTTVPRISFPPVGVGLRWFAAVLNDPILLQSVYRSFWLAIAAAVLGIVIAMPAAFAFERGNFRGRHMVELLLTGPRMIPQIVLALGLLIWLEHIGLGASFPGLLAAHLVLTVPYAFSTLLVSVATLDRRLEWSSAVLGASPLYTFRRVVMPQLKTGVIAALIFGFILSFNNVTLALFISDISNHTMPVELFNRMYIGGMTPVVPAFAVLLALCGVALFVVLDLKVGVYRYLAGGR